MFLGILTLVTALTISAVAIYYSVAGLVTIFSAAAIPIMIMGSALEIGKLVTAVWLHRYWRQTVWWLKTYLSIAVVILMFITSMGIFGFLSRAHIEQTANVAEIAQVIQRIDSDIERQNQTILRAEATIESIQSRNRNQETDIQDQIDREQDRINSAYSRIQPAVDEQLAIIARAEQDIENRTQVFSAQIEEIDRTLQDLQTALSANEVRVAQGIIGVRQDGSLGPETSRAIQSFRETQQLRRNELIDRIESVRSQPNTIADRAREEITRLRSLAEQEIADSNQLISRLRSQLGVDNSEEIQLAVSQQQDLINSARGQIEELLERKFQLEIEYRMFETEVGPIKYIAEFVYGSADKDLLEEAVRWVIIIIIFVFDPLAVLLLIASQYTFEIHRKEKQNTAKEKDKNEKFSRAIDEQSNQSADTFSDAEETPAGDNNHSRSIENDSGGFVGTQIVGKSLEDQREQELNDLDSVDEWKEAKHLWKEEHPNETLKEWKERYINGEIDRLPWEDYVQSSYKQNEEQNENSIWNRIKNRNE